MSFWKRFPEREKIISVYAVGMTILYFWALLSAGRDFVVNWSLYLGSSEILGLFSYIFAGTFFESLFLIFVLLFVSFLLPRKVLTDKFAVRGSVLVITFLGSIIYLSQITTSFGILDNIGKWGVFFLSFTLVLMLLAEFIPFVSRTIELLADRCIIFLYFYIPLSLVSMFFILLRNIG